MIMGINVINSNALGYFSLELSPKALDALFLKRRKKILLLQKASRAAGYSLTQWHS